MGGMLLKPTHPDHRDARSRSQMARAGLLLLVCVVSAWSRKPPTPPLGVGNGELSSSAPCRLPPYDTVVNRVGAKLAGDMERAGLSEQFRLHPFYELRTREDYAHLEASRDAGRCLEITYRSSGL